MNFTLVVPVYKNESNISPLVSAIVKINEEMMGAIQAVFVVDGSPDRSLETLHACILKSDLTAHIVSHSRNFGSFAAIKTGLQYVESEYYAVMAADLQEPPELVIKFFKKLQHGKCDIVIGERVAREDPLASKIFSKLFWILYKKYVVNEMPVSGVDVFGCNKRFRDSLLRLGESRSSLVAQLFWIGFEREYIPYTRAKRSIGRSSWTFKKKLDYMLDSVFSFTDLPLRLLTSIGLIGTLVSGLVATIVLIFALLGLISVPGYSAIMIAIAFFSALNLLAGSIVGNYVWRTYENTKMRPYAITSNIIKYKNGVVVND